MKERCFLIGIVSILDDVYTIVVETKYFSCNHSQAI